MSECWNRRAFECWNRRRWEQQNGLKARSYEQRVCDHDDEKIESQKKQEYLLSAATISESRAHRPRMQREPENCLVGIVKGVPVVDNHDSKKVDHRGFEIVKIQNPVI